MTAYIRGVRDAAELVNGLSTVDGDNCPTLKNKNLVGQPCSPCIGFCRFGATCNGFEERHKSVILAQENADKVRARPISAAIQILHGFARNHFPRLKSLRQYQTAVEASYKPHPLLDAIATTVGGHRLLNPTFIFRYVCFHWTTLPT